MTDDLVKRLRAIDHLSLEDCFCQSAFYSQAADRIEQLTAERDSLLRCVTDNHVALCRAEKAEAERDRLREALIELIQQTHNCERELTEDLHHVDFCGESAPLTNAREALNGETP